ncbi:hypothetical protein, partial [uncultured Ruminococcus sp.]|uniref:hypothetical protein n=1 Tax=uncultured Ruminococcus sp. TaxID=165186 RepID=UPI0026015AD4
MKCARRTAITNNFFNRETTSTNCKFYIASKKHQNQIDAQVHFDKRLKNGLQSAFWRIQQSLQNRVPRVQVLLPLPSKNGLNTAFKPFFHMFLCTEHGLNFR